MTRRNGRPREDSSAALAGCTIGRITDGHDGARQAHTLENQAFWKCVELAIDHGWDAARIHAWLTMAPGSPLISLTCVKSILKERIGRRFRPFEHVTFNASLARRPGNSSRRQLSGTRSSS